MDDDRKRHLHLLVALILISAAVLAIERPWEPGSTVPPPPEDLPEEALRFPAAANFDGGTGWINAGPVDLVDLRGKVVLVDFWTYSCINCIRTFPFLKAWWERYQDHGLVIVGVHTPEFRFERDAANVQDAAERYGLTWPIVQDNDYDVWDAYGNRFWPTKYAIDQHGRIRGRHIGEGGYEATETRIRELLAEAGYELPPPTTATDPDFGRTGGISPELYAGDLYGEGWNDIGNPEGYRRGERVAYARPADADVDRDRIYLVGTWDNHQENVTAVSDDARVLVRFKAVAANFVGAGPAGACVGVHLDGGPIPAELAGEDVDVADRQGGDAGAGDGSGDGPPCVRLDDPRNYKFFEAAEGHDAEHLLELSVPAGFSLFTFTFSPTPHAG